MQIILIQLLFMEDKRHVYFFYLYLLCVIIYFRNSMLKKLVKMNYMYVYENEKLITINNI